MSSHKDKITQLAQTLEEWDYKLDRLEHRVKGLPDELKVATENKYQKLLDYREVLKQKQQDLIESSEQAFDEIEASIEDAVGTFKLLFEDVEVHTKVEGM